MKEVINMYDVNDIARWFLQYNQAEQKISGDDVEGISNLKLQKLLYYAQGVYLAMYDEPLFNENIVAWQHGPVVVSIYEKYKRFKARSIEEADVSPVIVDSKAENILIWVYNEFGKYTAWALRNMTHEETPWKSTPQNGIISRDLIKNYFKKHYVEA